MRRVCTRCRQSKPATREFFYGNRNDHLGIGYLCIPCDSARSIDRRLRLKNTILSAYGSSCVCCGETEQAFLSIEHSRRDGAAHRARVGQGYSVYRDLKARGFPKDEGIEILCMNCQFGRSINKVCPHQMK